MNHEELRDFRINELEKQMEALVAWRVEATAAMAQALNTLNELHQTAADNKKTLKGIFASIIIGVSMLFITTIAAKLL